MTGTKFVIYLLHEKGFRLQGDIEESENGTILENVHLVGNNCLTYMTSMRCGVKTRCKIYDKMVQMLESKSVRGYVGAHWKLWTTQKNTRFAVARDEAREDGLTRMEITDRKSVV